MPFAIFRFHQDLSYGCPEEGIYPSPDRFEPCGEPYETSDEARDAARKLADEQRRSKYYCTDGFGKFIDGCGIRVA